MPCEDTDLRLIMEDALASTHGIEIETNDSLLFESRFHSLRNKLKRQGIQSYANLSIRIMNTNTVHLLKKE